MKLWLFKKAGGRNSEEWRPAAREKTIDVTGASCVESVKPGQSIRFPVEAKGRFESMAVNKWLGEYTTNVPNMHQLDDTGAGVVHKH